MHTTELVLVDRHITLEILDTAGIDEFPVMRRLAIARGDAFLIVYAINNASSFDIVRQMRQLVLEIKGDLLTSSIPMVIVGNKCDVDDKQVLLKQHVMNVNLYSMHFTIFYVWLILI